MWYAQRPLQTLAAWQRRYGDIFTVRFPGLGSGVYVAEPEAIRSLFTGDQSDLVAGEANSIVAPIVGPRSLLVLDGDEHERQRRVLLPPFQGEHVAGYRALARELAEREVSRWRPGQRLVLRHRMRRLTFEIMCRAIFGDAEPSRIERLRAALIDVIDSNPVYLLTSAARTDFGPLSPGRAFTRRLAVADTLIEEELSRREQGDRDGSTGGVLALLLSAHSRAGERANASELRDQIVTLLAAGYETTATAMTFALEFLLRNPDVLARLRAAIAASESDEYVDAVV
jgi:cytochrome P450